MAANRSPVPRTALISLLVLQLGLGALLAHLYLSIHHTLYQNGRWTATKTTLETGVMGAFSFLFSLQPLAGGHLNLSSWHGYQEVVLDTPLEPASVEFDFRLNRRAYLTFELRRDGSGFDGIRLSKHKAFPPARLRVAPGGRFLEKRLLRKLRRVRINRWHTLRVELAGRRARVFLDDQELHSFRLQPMTEGKIGFRGGKHPAFIDNVRVVSRDGSELLERFRQPRNAARVYALAAAAVPLFSWALFLALRRLPRAGDRRLFFFFLMFTALAVVLASLAWSMTAHRKGFYPDRTRRLALEEEYWRQAAAEEIFARIREAYPPRPAPGTHRIVFVGSSQTRGAGAARLPETWVRQTEELLNQPAGETRFECINTGVSGYRIAEMARDLTERWLALEPHTVVINAGNNNRGTNLGAFRRQLSTLVRASLESGAGVVLVMEPNSLEHDSDELRRLHGAMAAVGRRFEVPVIDMHQHLMERHDDGFLWWDWVHLTSFGQELFARHLTEELRRLKIGAAPEPA